MKARQQNPKEETRKLTDLIAHPLQQQVFDDLSPHALQALADDIQRNSLRDRIQILPRNEAGLPPNTIIDGHQRRNALLLQEETQTTVLVRYDLAGADAATIERAFLEFNQNRRHLDPLAKARVALRLYEIERTRRPGALLPGEEAEARERVGQVLGRSGRHLDRYWRLLRTPPEVQNAFRKGEISLVDGGRVAGLSNTDQRTIAKRLQAGDKPKDIVNAYLRPNERGQGDLRQNLLSLHRTLLGEVKHLRSCGGDEEVPHSLLNRLQDVLRQAQAQISELLADSNMDSGGEDPT